MHYITKVAKGEHKKLRIFGSYYPTLYGTEVKDYIHVMDLSEGHVVALNNLTEGANNIKIPYEIVDRGPGDIATC